MDIDLIANNVKYQVQACRTAQKKFLLTLNESVKEIETYEMIDGGLLLSLDGSSYTTYMFDDVERVRIEIDNQTVVFEKDIDPSVLRSPSAGKLVNLLVADGNYLDKDQEYAEIEVMKMVMSLRSPVAGHVTFLKRAGCILEPGTIIGSIELLDTNLVNETIPYTNTFGRNSENGDELQSSNVSLSGRHHRYILNAIYKIDSN